MPLKACPYCGRIHPKSFDCGRLPKYGRQKGTEEQRFRSSTAWTRKSIQIRARDNYMCVYCMLHDGRVNTEDVEVHHIIPVKEDYSLRLDNDNLVTLCREHHEAAEASMIKRDVLKAMAEEQEMSDNSRLPCL